MSRGQLRIYLGAAPGVPRKQMQYRGTSFEEMDTDAIIARHPQVVLVDELAHTNVPGSKNAKRWQDIEELLAAGITVLSTLNIQHLDSLTPRRLRAGVGGPAPLDGSPARQQPEPDQRCAVVPARCGDHRAGGWGLARGTRRCGRVPAAQLLLYPSCVPVDHRRTGKPLGALGFRRRRDHGFDRGRPCRPAHPGGSAGKRRGADPGHDRRGRVARRTAVDRAAGKASRDLPASDRHSAGTGTRCGTERRNATRPRMLVCRLVGGWRSYQRPK